MTNLPITITSSAIALGLSIESYEDKICQIVAGQAQRLGIDVRQMVLRADPDKDVDFVLDIYIGYGDMNARFAFWDIVSEIISENISAGEIILMVHTV